MKNNKKSSEYDVNAIQSLPTEPDSSASIIEKFINDQLHELDDELENINKEIEQEYIKQYHDIIFGEQDIESDVMQTSDTIQLEDADDMKYI